MRSTALVIVILVTGCKEMGAASCPKGDFACIEASLDPAELRAALEYAGPCYHMAREMCDRVEYCTGALADRGACVDWFIDEVCAAGAYQPARMDACADWAHDLSCDYFDDPRPMQDAYAAHHQVGVDACWMMYQHPIGGAAGYSDPVPPGA
jgi:hypothetical protein